MSTPSPAKLGPYELITPIGKGGMGEVWRARDPRLGREVAIKVLPEQFAKDAHRRERFEREARAVAALSHPNILALHDVGTHDDLTYAVMAPSSRPSGSALPSALRPPAAQLARMSSASRAAEPGSAL